MKRPTPLPSMEAQAQSASGGVPSASTSNPQGNEEPMTPSGAVADAKAVATLKPDAGASGSSESAENNRPAGDTEAKAETKTESMNVDGQPSEATQDDNQAAAATAEDVTTATQSEADTVPIKQEEREGGGAAGEDMDVDGGNTNGSANTGESSENATQEMQPKQEPGQAASTKQSSASKEAPGEQEQSDKGPSNDAEADKSNTPSRPNGVQPASGGAGAPAVHPLDEIMAMLKTGYPLLALSMETMVDQIQLKFKPLADEDMYRLVVALYNEGAQVCIVFA